MKLTHFEAFAPVCPRCRQQGRGDQPLTLAASAPVDGEVDEGMLACPLPACAAEYPILDGIPVLVSEARDHLAAHLDEWRARDDLSEIAESVLGDAAPADGGFARTRTYLSSYGLAHWGDLDLDGPLPDAGGLAPVLDAALALLPSPPAGRWIDLGCALGRGTFALAAATGAPTLGVDLNVPMLRAARRLLRTGTLQVGARRVGHVYGRRTVALAGPLAAAAPWVDLWCADATALPLRDGAVDGALSLNVLDSVHWPLSHLLELARALPPGAPALLATPYDWTAAVTPIEGWLGGHSQRNRLGGSSVAELRRILARTDRPDGAPPLFLEAEREDVAWRLRSHERLTMTYLLHLLALRRDG